MLTFAAVLLLSAAWLYAFVRFSNIGLNVRVSASIFVLSIVFAGTAALVAQVNPASKYLFALTVLFAGKPFIWRDTPPDPTPTRTGSKNPTRRNITWLLIAALIAVLLFDP